MRKPLAHTPLNSPPSESVLFCEVGKGGLCVLIFEGMRLDHQGV